MPIITNEQRDAAYDTATEAQKQLCSSPESGRHLKAIADKHQISDDTYLPFVLIAGDTVLGLRSRADLPQFLQIETGVTSEQALKITGDLIDFMEGKELSNKTTSNTGKTIPKPPVRTMANDMVKAQNSNEAVYSTTQEAILKEGSTH